MMCMMYEYSFFEDTLCFCKHDNPPVVRYIPQSISRSSEQYIPSPTKYRCNCQNAFYIFRWLVRMTSLDVSHVCHVGACILASSPELRKVKHSVGGLHGRPRAKTKPNDRLHENCFQQVAAFEPAPAICTLAHLPASLRSKSPPPQASPAALYLRLHLHLTTPLQRSLQWRHKSKMRMSTPLWRLRASSPATRLCDF